jgi:GNAT superfamily N-acetyltransferase
MGDSGAHADGPEVYARNTAAMWASLAPWSRPLPGPAQVATIAVPAQPALRVILRSPLAKDPAGHIAAVLARAPEGSRITVEDSFGKLRLPVPDGMTVLRLPIMVRPAAPLPQHPLREGMTVRLVDDEAALVRAERVIVDGFPRPGLQPFQPGRALPALILARPGWQVWLGCAGGEPAAVCCGYDDGAAVGIYWLATLPAFRSQGLGRALMTAALSAHPGRPAALAATAAGEPLYKSLGFQTVRQAVWYRKPARG